MNKVNMGLMAFVVVAILAVGMVSAVGPGCMKNGNGIFSEDREIMRLTVESGDYEAWKSLMESRITEDNFNMMVERHNEMNSRRAIMEELEEAWENNDFERVKEIKEELAESMPEKNCEDGECPRKNLNKEMNQKKGFFSKFKFWGRK